MALLVRGHIVEVPGVEVIPPASHGGPPWARLDPGDYRQRRTNWVRQVVVHTTKGIYPQHVIPGRGAGGRDRHVADFWHRDPNHSAAHIVVDNDGSVVCLADLGTVAAHHATVSNDWSVGVELYQEAGGGVHEAVYASLVPLLGAICDALEIPRQYLADPYRGRPRERLIDGGPNVVGVIGHRDNTHRRGRGDPGDEVFCRLRAADWEPLSLEGDCDLALARKRQMHLIGRGAHLTADGVCGPASLRAARAAGYARWADVPPAYAP